MNESKLATLEQFLAGTCDVAFAIPAEEPRLRAFVAKVLRRFRYFSRPKGQRGLLFEYMQRLSGYSRQHLSRLIAQYRDTHSIEPATRASRTSFSRKYQAEDVVLLAQTDSWHDTLSGPATQVLLRRAFNTFGDLRYERLSQISVSHLYNLRASPPYLKHRVLWRGTRPSAVPIGIRKAPAPQGLPGYIRIDTVHQGDQDGLKGVYHINAVDIVTQWELVASVERISEAYLLPVIALLLEGFPFAVRGFHSDSGSEYINYEIAGLLEKLRVESTKSRPRHTNDNALAESKNGAVIRKIMGYSHIPQKHATAINQFYTHRDAQSVFELPSTLLLRARHHRRQSKIKKTYPHDLIKTPFQRLQSIPDYALCLKAGITPQGLEHQAAAMSDNDAAKQVQQARKLLFQSINRRSKTAA